MAWHDDRVRVRGWIIGAFAAMLLLAACGGDPSATDQTETGTQTAGTSQVETVAPTVTQDTTADSEVPEEPIATCDAPIDEIEVGAVVESEIIEGDDTTDTRYYCVEIPTGTDSFTVALTGMTDNLDLFVAYPDLKMLQEGGFGLQISSARETADESVKVDIDPDLIWGPGAYYIEVSARDTRDSSTFSLAVTVP